MRPSSHDADSREFFDSDGNALTEEERNAAIARLQQVELCSPAVLRRAAENLEAYRVPAEAVELLRETLKGFLGTKNYHNYTNHKQAADPSCKRWVDRGYPLCYECIRVLFYIFSFARLSTTAARRLVSSMPTPEPRPPPPLVGCEARHLLSAASR